MAEPQRKGLGDVTETLVSYRDCILKSRVQIAEWVWVEEREAAVAHRSSPKDRGAGVVRKRYLGRRAGQGQMQDCRRKSYRIREKVLGGR